MTGYHRAVKRMWIPLLILSVADGSVTVREPAAGRCAVLRYSGGRTAKKETESLARLKTWMESERLSVLSPPVHGYFDPPWTPFFLRRNEVMLRTEAGK